MSEAVDVARFQYGYVLGHLQMNAAMRSVLFLMLLLALSACDGSEPPTFVGGCRISVTTHPQVDTLSIGSTATLRAARASTCPQDLGPIRWTSKDPHVAALAETADSLATVIALTPGITYIRAELMNHSGAAAASVVHVQAAP